MGYVDYFRVARNPPRVDAKHGSGPFDPQHAPAVEGWNKTLAHCCPAGFRVVFTTSPMEVFSIAKVCPGLLNISDIGDLSSPRKRAVLEIKPDLLEA